MPSIVWICRIRFVFARIHGFACSFLCYGKVKYDYRKSKYILLPIKVHTINIETKNTYWKLSTTLTCLFGYTTPGRDSVIQISADCVISTFKCKLYEPNKIFTSKIENKIKDQTYNITQSKVILKSSVCGERGGCAR